MSLEKKVEIALAQIRPFLNEDGGDVELVEVTTGGTARVRFKGACKTCRMSHMTFTAGVENAIKLGVPEIKKVEIIQS